MKKLTLILTSCVALALNSTALVTIDYTAVGNPGNANDPVTGYGGVGYDYWISKYEVTVGQYAEFLNAVAKADPRALYATQMGSVVQIAGISRAGASGSYAYSVVGDPNKPVTYVNWFDAARFVNWLYNGQPVGAQGNATTDTGVYNLGTASSGVGFPRLLNNNYALPSINEWYKAAYYDQSLNAGSGGYWLYPTRNNTQPNSRYGSPSDPNSANAYYNDGIVNGYNGGYAVNDSTSFPSVNALTPVGAFSLASSYYGTFDQGGNVSEWTEEIFGSSPGGRGVRGGSWSNPMSYTGGNFGDSTAPGNQFQNLGFRVVILPEPGPIALVAIGAALMAVWRRRSI